MIKEKLGDWYPVLQPLVKSKGFASLGKTLKAEENIGLCPQFDNIFNAFEKCQLKNLKAIILGQDPYPQRNVATGLAFANKSDTVVLSASLEILRTEMERDLNTLALNFDPTLESWANQGVLLLNSALTCRVGFPGSHAKLWKPFMDKFFHIIYEELDLDVPTVAMGGAAKQIVVKYDGLFSPAEILFTPHPVVESYGSGGFYGSRPFSWINAILHMYEKKEILWT